MITRWLHTVLMVTTVVLSAMPLCAQTPIGGVVNNYTAVTGIRTEDCTSKIDVGSTTSLAKSDLVLIIQMKGAYQSGQYNTRAVGLYEFATIDSISGSTIILKHALLNSYDVTGRVQLVRVPILADADVNMPLTGAPWDGITGGVIALDVRGTLRLNANIVADGIGFRGGARWRGRDGCSVTTANDVINSQTAAMKGESYVEPLVNNVSGRQELFSGGGGGVVHNSGGGGGGNGGMGGRGGAQWDGCPQFFDNGGLGGVTSQLIINTTPRARCGGGGGAGQNNDNVGTGGANGGGIIIIRCATLAGNARRITANGLRPATDAANDGAGGGGAGGSIILAAATVIGGIYIDANGGIGGNVRTSSKHGPGGGGGAGTFIFSGPSPVAGMAFSLAGGTNGRNVNQTGSANQSYLALPGDDGQSAFGYSVPENTGSVPPLDVRAPRDTIVCPGTPLKFTAVVTGNPTRITWRTSGGAVVSTQPDFSFVAAATEQYIVSVENDIGCIEFDTVVVSVSTGWKFGFPDVTLTAPSCTSMMDTALWLFNNSNTDATIRSITSPSPNATITFPSAVVLKPGERYRIPVAVNLPTNSPATAVRIDVGITPCDTAITAFIVVQRNDRVITMSPQRIDMPEQTGCTFTPVDTTIYVRFSSSNTDPLAITDIIEQGAVRLNFPKQFATRPNVDIMIPIQWIPSAAMSAGRLGFVIQDGACIDTQWIDIDGKVNAPRIAATPFVDVSTLILCQNSRAEVDVELTSQDTTTWEVSDVSIVGSATTDITIGTRFVSRRTVRVNVTPTQVGPYEIILTIRLQPCDTNVVIRIRGNAVDVSADGTPLLVYTEPVIGRRQSLRSAYTNTGTTDIHISAVTAPQAPFTITTTTPVVPCVLTPGQQLFVDVELLQRFGVHVDSLVVTVDAPCLGTLTTVLQAEATAITGVAMPDLTAGIGVLDTVPVLLVRRPAIDSALLGEFRVSISWNARDLAVTAGQDARASWDVELIDDTIVTNIIGRWDGSDTLALIPVTTLLSPSTRTDLLFIREPGFLWTGQQSLVEYDDGSMTIDDVCATRNIRTILFNGVGALTIAPHPVRETLTLHFDVDRSHSAVIEIINVMGQTVLSATTTIDRECSIDVHELARGSYILRATIGTAERTAPLLIH